MGQEKRPWAVGDLMTKGSKAVCGGVDTEEESLHIKERCDCALASGSASRGPQLDHSWLHGQAIRMLFPCSVSP